MRKIRDVLRLNLGERLSRRTVGAAVGLPYPTVADYLVRARAAGLGWPLPAAMDDAELEARLFPAAPRAAVARPPPDFGAVHTELRRKGVTLELLWVEYRERHPDGYGYSRFCHLYRRWRRRVDVVMRQEHRAGEKLFVDFAGQTVPVVDPATGEVTQAAIFVAVLGASSYTYAEAVPSQALPHWIAAHVHAFAYLRGCPAILVPDNLKAGVARADRYEPDVNRTYRELAAHYGCAAVIPARPNKPRDKAKAETGVLLVERWILARLRKRRFFSLAELNDAIRGLLDELNARPFKKLPGSRRSLFEALDRPALEPLPARPCEYATWKLARVNVDYHVEAERHWYSVPHQLVGQQLEVRLTATTVEAFHRGRRVASHVRDDRPYAFTTDPAHMPAAHRAHREWSPERILRWARTVGPKTAGLVEGVLTSRPHPEQGFRSCLGILRLGKTYGDQRLEAACGRALALRAFSYRSVESILRTGLDRQPLLALVPPPVPLQPHGNLRGPGYYR